MHRSQSRREATWAYRATATMTAAGGGDLKLTVSFGTSVEAILQKIMFGPDDYTGGETIAVEILNEDGDIVDRLMIPSADNDQWVGPGSQYVSEDAANSQALTIGASEANYPVIIGGSHTLRFDTTDLVQNETLTVELLFRIFSPTLPTPVWTSSGTVSVATDWNRVQ